MIEDNERINSELDELRSACGASPKFTPKTSTRSTNTGNFFSRHKRSTPSLSGSVKSKKERKNQILDLFDDLIKSKLSEQGLSTRASKIKLALKKRIR